MKELIVRIKREVKHLDNKLWTVEQSISREKENLVEANENLKELKSQIAFTKAVKDEEFKNRNSAIAYETLNSILKELKKSHDDTLVYIQKTKVTLEQLSKSKLETEAHIGELEELVDRVSSYDYGKTKVKLSEGESAIPLRETKEDIISEILNHLEKKFILDK